MLHLLYVPLLLPVGWWLVTKSALSCYPSLHYEQVLSRMQMIKNPSCRTKVLYLYYLSLFTIASSIVQLEVLRSDCAIDIIIATNYYKYLIRQRSKGITTEMKRFVRNMCIRRSTNGCLDYSIQYHEDSDNEESESDDESDEMDTPT